MDELCKMLADKLGIVADSSINWLQTAIPQYAKMMAITNAIYTILAIIGFIIIVFVTFYAYKKADECDIPIIIFVGVMFILMSIIFICICLPNVICWTVTPDAMLLKTLMVKVM